MNANGLIDGAKLVALSSPGGVIRPRGGVSGPVWLDLAALEPEVASGRARTVASAFAPLLLVDDATRLIVRTGGGNRDDVVSAFGAAVPAAQRKQLRLATIRGEGVLDRLEEFVLAGVEFRSESGRKLDLRMSPAGARCDPPPSSLAAALQDGASLLVSAGATRATAEAAVAASPDSPDALDVSYSVENGARLWAAIGHSIDQRAFDEVASQAIEDGVEVSVARFGEVSLLSLASPSTPGLRVVARRLDLLVDGAPAPLERFIKMSYDEYHGRVPRGLFELAPDIRSLDEWLES